LPGGYALLGGDSGINATARTGPLQEGRLEAATTRRQLELAAANIHQKNKTTKQNPKNVLNVGWIVWHSEGAKQGLKNQCRMETSSTAVRSRYFTQISI
jgi:hypothetical protein